MDVNCDGKWSFFILSNKKAETWYYAARISTRQPDTSKHHQSGQLNCVPPSGTVPYLSTYLST